MKTSSLSRELVLFLSAVAVGALLVPAVIYVVGHRLFGAYGTGNNDAMSTFYRALFQDFVTLHWPAWSIVLGPAIVFLTLRWLVFVPLTSSSATASRRSERREPSL